MSEARPVSAGEMSVSELRERIGDLRQVCRIDRLTYDDGPGRGSRLLRMVTGGGLEVELHPDRCLDIGNVTWRGQPLAWASPAPVTSPWLLEHGGERWLRGFGGGLITTCGLDQFGSPSHDGGEDFGLHGRASSLVAEHLSTDVAQGEDGQVHLQVRAKFRQARLFGENLLLRRTVSSTLGSASFILEDAVTNLGADRQPHLMLYHCNVGWPLLDAGAHVEIPSTDVIPRDEVAAAGLEQWRTVTPPEPGWQEQVLLHHLPAEPVTVRVVNERAGLALAIQFDPAQLPHLFQWRHFACGVQVLGLEPANAPEIGGRNAARRAGVLPMLEPGETRHYRVEFSASGS